MSSLSVTPIANVFMLRPDGTAPEGISQADLQAAGFRCVVPTPVPREPGMVAYECEPWPRPDGLWQQVWELKQLDPAHNTAPEPEARTPDQIFDEIFAALGLDTPEKQAAFRSLLASGLN